jgi:tetratricopeptide (TPR) repeat protein
MKRLPSLNGPILVAAASLVLGLLTGFGQFKGFFGRVSFATAAASLVVAAVVARVFPDLLRKHEKKGRGARFTARQLSAGLAVLVAALGTLPLVTKLGLAAREHSRSTQLLDLGRAAPAMVEFEQAARRFEEIGLPGRALRSRIALTQAKRALGEYAQARALLAEIEKSPAFTPELRGTFEIVSGSLAYSLGEFETAERHYQAAHQLVPAGSRDMATLLHNEGVLWYELGAEHRLRAADNFRAAGALYAGFRDRIGLAQMRLAEANLHVDEPAEAVPRLLTALAAADSAHQPLLAGTVALNLGMALSAQNRFEEADHHFERARAEFAVAADIVALAELRLAQSRHESRRGRDAVARQRLNEATAYLRSVGPAEGRIIDVRKLASLTVQQADLFDERGASDSAEKRYQDALGLYAASPAPEAEAAARVNYAAMLLRLNREAEAQRELRHARELLRGRDLPRTEDVGVLRNNMGEYFKRIGAYADARAEFAAAESLFRALGRRLRAAQALENVALLDYATGSGDSLASRVERAVAVYDSLEQHDLRASGAYHLFAIYTEAHDPRARLQIPRMLRILKDRQVAQETEAEILFGLWPDDLPRSDLIWFRERVRGLHAFYEKEKNPVGLARSLLQRARIERSLGNRSRAAAYADSAAPYGEHLDVKSRAIFYGEVAGLLTDVDPARALDLLWRSFDLEVDEAERLRLLRRIGTRLPSVHGEAREASRAKLASVARASDGAVGVAAKRMLGRLE